MSNLLIIDDDAKHRSVIRHLVEKKHPQANVYELDPSDMSSLDDIADILKYDLVIMDSQLSMHDGLQWMQSIVERYDDAPQYIVLSSSNNVDTIDSTKYVIKAIKQGATNFYFKKKLNLGDLLADIADAMGKVRPDEHIKAMAVKGESIVDTWAEINLAQVVKSDYSKWPFSGQDVLEGNATFGNYQILSYLGEDDTASTFLASMADISRPAVIKLVNRLRMEGKLIPASFANKFDALQHCRHPNIYQLYKYEIVENRLVIAHEYLEYGTLEQKLKCGKLPEQDAMKYFRQMMLGMQALHDIKIRMGQMLPKHFMFRNENTLVITQPRLVYGLHALSEVTGEWSGHFSYPIYNCPENIHQPGSTDTRSDIYYAGLIGYEMFAGEPMYGSGSMQDILYAHTAEPPRDLPDPRHPMNRILKKMLCKSPDDRFQSANEVLASLDDYYLAA